MGISAKWYSSYTSSSHWKGLSATILINAGFQCEVCGSARNLLVHHLTYERIGEELQSDLLCLCTKCHAMAHKEDTPPDGIDTIYNPVPPPAVVRAFIPGGWEPPVKCKTNPR